jgi:hypothetical protein
MNRPSPKAVKKLTIIDWLPPNEATSENRKKHRDSRVARVYRERAPHPIERDCLNKMLWRPNPATQGEIESVRMIRTSKKSGSSDSR